MSEFQYVGFRAIDGPVSEENLAFMQRQSSRAKITPMSFDNEYNYGDFRGNAAEMLRRGYDVHLHYANYGVRKLLIRLPHGLPDPGAAAPYLDDEGFTFLKDKEGPGGILCLQPCHEPGDLDELWDVDVLLERLLPLRAEILDGDLRPFYLAHLAIGQDMNHDLSEMKEAPVPAGLDKLTAAQQALADLYDIKQSTLAAAAANSPALSSKQNVQELYAAWLRSQSEETKTDWLVQLLDNSESTVRRQLLVEFRKASEVGPWPTKRTNRTLADLEAAAEIIHANEQRRDAEKAARARAKKLADMAADPAATLRETEELARQRSGQAYDKMAQLLADLREALATTDQAGLAEKQARKIKDKYPTLNRLTSALRAKGFVKKAVKK